MLFRGKTIELKPIKLLANTILFTGIFLLCRQWFFPSANSNYLGITGLCLFIVGSIGHIYVNFLNADSANIQHFTWFRSLGKRSISAWLLGLFLTGFYVALY